MDAFRKSFDDHSSELDGVSAVDYPVDDVMSIILGPNRYEPELLFREAQDIIEEIERKEEVWETESSDTLDLQEIGDQVTTNEVVIETTGSDVSEDFRGFSPILDFIPHTMEETCSSIDSPHCIAANPPKLIIASYGLTAFEKIIIKKYCYVFGYEYTDSVSKTYSVLVSRDSTSDLNNYSFKLLVALAGKAKIVKLDWVYQSIKYNKALPEENYLLLKPNSQFSHRIFSGINLVTDLLQMLCPHEPEAIEHLFHLTGGNVISTQDLPTLEQQKKKIILFMDEHQLDVHLLSECARYRTLAVNIKWVEDSLRQGVQLSVIKYLSYTFPLTEETMALYGIKPLEDQM